MKTELIKYTEEIRDRLDKLTVKGVENISEMANIFIILSKMYQLISTLPTDSENGKE